MRPQKSMQLCLSFTHMNDKTIVRNAEAYLEIYSIYTSTPSHDLILTRLTDSDFHTDSMQYDSINLTVPVCEVLGKTNE